MVYYVGAYRSENIVERDPQGSVAEDVKMAYIISAIKNLKTKVTVVSILASLKHGFHGRKTCVIDDSETQVYLESYDETRKGLSKIGVMQRLFSLFLYLFIYAGKNDTVLVYNTQLYSVPVRAAKWFKHFKLVLEVEEIFYMDNRNPVDVKRKPLEEALINAADAYVFASKLLAERLSKGKPYAVIYGAYTIPPQYIARRDDGDIHVVYAGGIDSLRRVDRAVKAFAILPDNYKFHILGFGSRADLEYLLQCISEVNAKAGFDKTEYVGCLSGREYDEYLQSCHIGLNMQAIGESIEAVAFPSKLSSYLSRGLSVISGNLISVVHSPLARGIRFFTDNTEYKIAEAILSCELRTYTEQVVIIEEAERQFMRELRSIIY